MTASEIHSWWITDTGNEGGHGTPDRLFPYWSFTKTAIAICALGLSEKGRSDIDRPVGDARWTLRQLLAHTAGLPDYCALPGYQRDVVADRTPWPRENLLRETMSLGTLFQPGEGWAYSNLGYMLAREEIERASGQGFAQLFEDMIAKPLGLDSVTYATTRAQFSRIYWTEAARYHPGWVYHGCLMGTARDAARLLHALFFGKLLTVGSLAQMTAARPLGGAIEGRPWTECGYGLGLMIGRTGEAGRTLGHSGSGPFSVNAVYHFPALGTPITVASFAHGPREGLAEHAAADLALSLQ